MSKIINIVDKETRELIASISDDDVILKDEYEVIETED
ncbi:hypothetical protein BN997_01116 [Oceanobacillus oncorhynchi]|uniref:Uncharacterized protein n=1 Tax=Oceanobacillus oncorhynchi TaxID=545501 RepID=A0A0A1ME32_9BACI|nr:hypothetical protein BN997_01116 [Oceanobacillus oncorhynchi]